MQPQKLWIELCTILKMSNAADKSTAAPEANGEESKAEVSADNEFSIDLPATVESADE